MASAIKAAIVGGIVLFIWSAISWMFLPWHTQTIHGFKNDKAVAEVLKANAGSSGIYLMPSMKQGEAATSEKMQMPMVFSAVHLEGMPASMQTPMIISFATQLIAAFFVAWLLLRTKGLSYLGRVSFVVIFALAAGIVTELPYWTWFGFDAQFTLVAMADLLIGWFLAGLVMALVCNRK